MVATIPPVPKKGTRFYDAVNARYAEMLPCITKRACGNLLRILTLGYLVNFVILPSLIFLAFPRTETHSWTQFPQAHASPIHPT